jgi:hypothetical protein
MSDASDAARPAKVRSLAEAMRRVRIADADRSDVVVELREAERVRLDMLADALRSVIAEVPKDDDQFSFAVVTGTQPRLWIDMTSFVMLGRDRRTYRFLKDTRLGRTIILETPDIDAMADTVTNYVAERIIERERALEGDWLMKRVMEGPPALPAPERAETARPETIPVPETAKAAAAEASVLDANQFGWVAAAFLLGMLLGIGGLLTYAWISVP